MDQPQLEMVDIVNAAKIIEAAIERSAFKAGEMSGVAATFDKFAAYVAYHEEQARLEHEQAAKTEKGE